MIVKIKRLKDNGVQTIGELSIFEDGVKIFSCKTLELPWKDNQRSISCIPEGKYPLVHRQSKKYGDHLHIRKVPGRYYILMHSANYFHQLKGCIAVGREFMHIDDDKQIDINASRDTLRDIVYMLERGVEHTLIIKDQIKMDKKQLIESLKVGAKEGIKSFTLNIGKNKADSTLNKKGKLNKPRLIAAVLGQLAKWFIAYKGIEIIAPKHVDAAISGIFGGM